MRHMRLGTWSRRVLAWHNMLHLRRCESSLGHDREAGENGTSTMTSSHDVIQRSDAHVDYEMVKRVIEQTVPMTYTSVAQIARALPCDVLETLSVSAITDENTSGSKDERASPREECPMKPWQGAGLTGFLADHSALFELSRIGPIAVVRRRVGATFPASVCASSFSVDSASHADHKGCTAASSRTVMCTSDCSSSRPDYATHDGDRHTMRACRVTSNPSKRNSYSAECVHAVPALASHSLSEKLRPPPYFVAESSASSSSSWHPAPSHSQRLLLLHHERDALRMERVNIPQAVMRRYPSYLIPVHALWTDCTAGGENEVDKAGRSAGTEESSKEGNMHTRRQQRKECVLRALSFHLPYLTLQGGRWRPGHSSMDDTAENAPGMLISNTCHTKGEPITDTTNANDSGDDDARALEEMYGYVSLSSAATAALRRSRCAGYRSEAAETNEANSAQLRRRQSRRGEERHNFDGTHVAPDLLYTRYRVSEYEWYRVARLIPQLGVDVPVTDRFMLQARALLPPGRGVMHVLYSAPHLFHITCSTSCTDKPSMHKAISSREGASTDAAAATVAAPMCGDSKKDTDCVRLSSASFQVRFILHPYYIPPQHHSREELQTQLDALDSRTAASFPSASSTRPRLATVEATTSSSMVEQRIIRNRRKRRALTRQLEYLIRPSPFFDERVLAQCLFDALPMHDGVPVHKLVGTALPMSARACMPRDGSALLRRYPHLFSVVTPHDGVTMLSNGISFCQAHGTNRLCRSDEHEQQREQKLHSPQQRDGHAIAPMTTHAAITAAGAAALCSPASVTMVYRSDVAMAVPRAARSIDGEEILLELFNRFPAHQHPARGTCIFRCLAKLPVVMQQRLHQTCSVEEEILRPYPEKVEVLTRSHNRVSFKQAQRPHRSCQQEEEQQRPPCLRSRMYSMSMNTLDKCGVPTDGAPATAEVSYTEEQLRCCRGRRDFFIAFRFVGAWQKELLRRYEKVCLKTGRDATV